MALIALATSGACRAEAAPSDLPDLSGRWAILQVASQIGVVPIVGERTRTTTSVAIALVTQEGNVVRGTQAACSTTIDPGTSLVRMEISDAFVLSMPQAVWSAVLEPSEGGYSFVRPWMTVVSGAILEDPETDSLPTSPDDPRVIDQDEDGKPGLTVRVVVMGFISGEVYVVQRDRSRLSGTVLGPGAIDGLVEWTSEQSVLGASSSMFLAGTAARVDPVAENSYFRARRVDNDATCADLTEMAAALFGD